MLNLVSRYRWWLILASATIFLLMLGFELSILPEAAADKCKEPASTNNNYCPSYIVAGAFLDSMAGFLKPYSDVLTAIAGVIVAVFTATLWTTTRKMWRASVEQLRHSELTAERQLRAYVVIDDMTLQNVGPGEQPQAVVILKNCGQTPAYNVRQIVAIGFVNYPADNAPTLAHGGPIESVSLIGPGGESRLEAMISGRMSADQYHDLLRGNKAIHIIGKISYRDAFNVERYTNFNCFYGGGFGLSGDSSPFHAPTGNDAN